MQLFVGIIIIVILMICWFISWKPNCIGIIGSLVGRIGGGEKSRKRSSGGRNMGGTFKVTVVVGTTEDLTERSAISCGVTIVVAVIVIVIVISFRQIPSFSQNQTTTRNLGHLSDSSSTSFLLSSLIDFTLDNLRSISLLETTSILHGVLVAQLFGFFKLGNEAVCTGVGLAASNHHGVKVLEFFTCFAILISLDCLTFLSFLFIFVFFVVDVLVFVKIHIGGRNIITVGGSGVRAHCERSIERRATAAKTSTSDRDVEGCRLFMKIGQGLLLSSSSLLCSLHLSANEGFRDSTVAILSDTSPEILSVGIQSSIDILTILFAVDGDLFHSLCSELVGETEHDCAAVRASDVCGSKVLLDSTSVITMADEGKFAELREGDLPDFFVFTNFDGVESWELALLFVGATGERNEGLDEVNVTSVFGDVVELKFLQVEDVATVILAEPKRLLKLAEKMWELVSTNGEGSLRIVATPHLDETMKIVHLDLRVFHLHCCFEIVENDGNKQVGDDVRAESDVEEEVEGGEGSTTVTGFALRLLDHQISHRTNPIFECLEAEEQHQSVFERLIIGETIVENGCIRRDVDLCVNINTENGEDEVGEQDEETDVGERRQREEDGFKEKFDLSSSSNETENTKNSENAEDTEERKINGKANTLESSQEDGDDRHTNEEEIKLIPA